MSTQPDARRCYSCGGLFSEYPGGDPDVHRQSLKNRKWLALLDDSERVLQETCEQCAADIEDAAGELDYRDLGQFDPPYTPA